MGESNPIQPLIGRLVSNQLPEPVRLPSVQLVYPFLHVQISQAQLARPAIQQLVAMTQEAPRSATVQRVSLTKPTQLPLGAADRSRPITAGDVHAITLMPTCDVLFAVPTLHTVSLKWTHPESNWGLRHARAVSSPWTMSPCLQVDRRGVEPRLPGCKPSVLPLNEQPICKRSVRDLNPIFRLTTAACYHNTYRPSFQ